MMQSIDTYEIDFQKLELIPIRLDCNVAGSLNLDSIYGFLITEISYTYNESINYDSIYVNLALIENKVRLRKNFIYYSINSFIRIPFQQIPNILLKKEQFPPYLTHEDPVIRTITSKILERL